MRVSFLKNSMFYIPTLTRLIERPPYNNSTNARLPVVAVNNEVKIPIHKVTAKPLTGPDPIANKTTPTIKVVKLESIIVAKAYSNPRKILALGYMPNRISSRMRSKIKTFASTAMPKVKTIPAIPGSVSVAPIKDIIATNKTKFASKAMSAIIPNTL